MATAIAVAAVVLFLPAAAWSSSPLVVTNTSDSGAGSLRQAIVDANANPGSTIAFNIPTSDPGFNAGGWFTISPLSPLPNLDADGTTIDGTTQTTFTGNTNPAGPEIFLDGRLVSFDSPGSSGGLWINGSSTTVDGVTISGFVGQEIVIDGGHGTVVLGDYLGTDPTGTSSVPVPFDPRVVEDDAIQVVGGATDTIIGGTTAAARNVISGNHGFGILVTDGANGLVVEGNYIGTSSTGTFALGDTGDGIWIGPYGGHDDAPADPSFVIGGSAPGSGNLISGNGGGFGEGVDVGTNGVVIQGNLIGTDVSGTYAIPNGNNGVTVEDNTANTLIGGTTAGARNVLSGNNVGIDVRPGSRDTVIESNYVGTNAAGTAALGNGYVGINLFEASAASVTGNVISGNQGGGIGMNFADDVVIQGNLIGTDASGMHAIPNGFAGVHLNQDDTNTLIGGTTAATRNVISGNNGEGYGYGIEIGIGGAGVVIEGNYIGTNAVGTAALGNATDGVRVDGGASDVTIGGTAPGAGNVISGNGAARPAGQSGAGVGVGSADAITIEGNLIGTDGSGAYAIPNDDSGVRFFENVTHAVIGGTTAAARNVISGNHEGVFLGPGSTGDAISGNYIGTNASGTSAVPNAVNGVDVFIDATGTLIGGTTAGAGNLIAYNAGLGVSTFATGTIVQGNTIERNGISSPAVCNFGCGGVLVLGDLGASGAQILGNAIADNGAVGIAIQDSDSNVVQGNQIQRSGPQGSGGAGIDVSGSDNLIGGSGTGQGNVISANTSCGVCVHGGTGNAISRNSIFSNGRLGIDLGGDGVTLNDPGDTDTGPNNLQNFPVLTSAGIVAGQLVVQGTIDTPSPQSVTIEIYANAVPAPGADPSGYGEGAVFLGTATPSSSGSFTVSLPAVASGTRISATATDAAGDTSEFAKDATGATTSLCTLTTQFVQSSSNYQRLKPAQKRAVDLLATAACQFVAAIAPRLNASQKAALVAGYKKAVQGLAHDGWLTAEQSAILISLASSL